LVALRTDLSVLFFIHSYLLVPDLPINMDWGVKALPNPTGDGALLFRRKEIYELKYDSSGWQWIKKQSRLKFDRYSYTAMYLPEQLTEC